MDHPAGLFAAIVVTFFVAGTVKGVTGMGLPTVAMGVLGALLSPVIAAALLVVPSFITNVWQLLAGPSILPLVRRLWPMLGAIALGTVGCSALLTKGDTRLTTAALGAALIVYAAYSLVARQLRIPAPLESWLSPLIGAATGAVTGGTGVFVIPAVPYLQALGLEKDALVQALGLSFTVSTVALAAGLAWHGALAVGDLETSMFATVPALAGMAVGQTIRSRISAVLFRRWFFLCLLLLGLEMTSRSLI